MKQFIFLLCLIIIFGCGPNEAEEEDKAQPITSLEFTGIEVKFFYFLKEIRITNHNGTAAKISIKNINSGSWLVNAHVLWAGSTKLIENSRFRESDEILIEVWLGPEAVWDGNVFGRPPDHVGRAVLVDGEVNVNDEIERTAYTINLPQVNGARCTISGQYNINNPSDQLGNNLKCTNISSDLVEVELYLIKSQNDKYISRFQLSDFSIATQGGQDSSVLDWDFQENEALAIRVYALDLFYLESEVWGFTINPVSQSWTQINGNINLP